MYKDKCTIAWDHNTQNTEYIVNGILYWKLGKTPVSRAPDRKGFGQGSFGGIFDEA